MASRIASSSSTTAIMGSSDMLAFHGIRSHCQTSGAVILGGARGLNAKPLRHFA
jgi:hypothetical protein